MTDREKRGKVIADLELQIAWIRDNDFHKFPGWGHSVLAMRDALALLKAQEPVEPYEDEGRYYCRCGNRLHKNIEFVGLTDVFCSRCGRKVKWK